MSEQSLVSAPWTGVRLPRREDPRMVAGRGRFTDDLPHPHALHLSFVRSTQAAGTITSIDIEAAAALPGVRAVFTAADLGNPGLAAALERDQFITTTMPLLAVDRVRFVGEPIAVVVADDPYIAEDGAELVVVEIEALCAVMSMRDALTGAGPVHTEAADGVLLDLPMFEDAQVEDRLEKAHLVVDKTFTSARVSACPLEGRSALAEWDARAEQLVLYLGLPERSVRVIAPDVGGGFGLKCVLGREEAVAAMVARKLGKAARWSEDRQENLTASFHGHEQEYRIRAAFDAEGHVQALDADIRCDIGAYSVFPFTCGVEPLMAATELPGVYKVGHYAARGRAIATNKPPSAPYRGVSRPQIVLVMERVMEAAAKQLGIDPVELRRRNLIQPEDFPYIGPNSITYDVGSYLESLQLCDAEVENAGWRTAPSRRPAARRRPRLLLRTDGLRHCDHGSTQDADDARLRRRAHPDGSLRRRGRHHRHLRARTGPRDDLCPDRGGPARRASGPGQATSGRHRPVELRLGHLR